MSGWRVLLEPYARRDLFERAHAVRPRLQDDLLHALVADPEFESRPTIPCPPPSFDQTPPTVRSASVAPPVDADDWCDGWLPPREMF